MNKFMKKVIIIALCASAAIPAYPMQSLSVALKKVQTIPTKVKIAVGAAVGAAAVASASYYLWSRSQQVESVAATALSSSQPGNKLNQVPTLPEFRDLPAANEREQESQDSQLTSMSSSLREPQIVEAQLFSAQPQLDLDETENKLNAASEQDAVVQAQMEQILENFELAEDEGAPSEVDMRKFERRNKKGANKKRKKTSAYKQSTQELEALLVQKLAQEDALNAQAKLESHNLLFDQAQAQISAQEQQFENQQRIAAQQRAAALAAIEAEEAERARQIAQQKAAEEEQHLADQQRAQEDKLERERQEAEIKQQEQARLAQEQEARLDQEREAAKAAILARQKKEEQEENEKAQAKLAQDKKEQAEIEAEVQAEAYPEARYDAHLEEVKTLNAEFTTAVRQKWALKKENEKKADHRMELRHKNYKEHEAEIKASEEESKDIDKRIAELDEISTQLHNRRKKAERLVDAFKPKAKKIKDDRAFAKAMAKAFAPKELPVLERPEIIKAFATLGLPNTATLEEIKSEYKKLARQKHPDKNPDNPNAGAEFGVLETAYKLLCDALAKEQK